MTSKETARPISWQAALLIPFLAGAIGMGLTLFLENYAEVKQAEAATGGPAPVLVKGAGSSYSASDEPARLIIPAINVDANIQQTGLSATAAGEMGVPTNFTDVAWYDRGAVPGALGTAVIDGHLDGKYVPQAVFYNLGQLSVGDTVTVITKGGKTLTFKVTGKKIIGYNETAGDIFVGNPSQAGLDLITCAGDWIASNKVYNQRVVVYTELVN